MNVEINVDDLLIAEQNSVQPELKYNIAATAETLLPSAQLLQHTPVSGSFYNTQSADLPSESTIFILSVRILVIFPFLL